MQRLKPDQKNDLWARIDHWHTRFESVLAASLYFLAAGILIVDVFARNLFHISWLGSTSVAVLAAVCAGFIGLSLATGTTSHLRIEAFDQQLPESLRPVAIKMGHFVAAGIYFFLAWHAFWFVEQSARWGDRAQDLPWPIWIFQAVMPLAFCSTALRHVGFIFRPVADRQSEA